MTGLKTGYACGVFDLYHAGHARLIGNARAFCDHLVIGLSTDELASSKNKTPIYSYEDRREILLSIKGVDAVIPQTSYDKYEAWKRINHDRLFVGDDWFGDDKWNEYGEKLGAQGVDIIYLPYTTRISSTSVRACLEQENLIPNHGSESFEEIYHNDMLLACVLRAGFSADGIKFLTSDNLEMQLGYMRHSKGHMIEPHVHKKFARHISGTCETLLVRSGEVKATIFSADKVPVQNLILQNGDILLLVAGGHSFEFLTDSEMIEIKQGPYAGDNDKTRFALE